MAFQALLPVVFKEKLSVVKAGAENAFIADLYVMDCLCAAVSDGKEVRHQGAVFISDRIVSLMISHRGNDSRYRKLQEFFIDAAIERCRIFNEVVDFFKKVCIVPDIAAQFFRLGKKALADHVAAFILIDNDRCLAHGFLVVFRAFNRDIFLAEKTMSAADSAALDMSKFHRNDFAAAESDDPADRTDETGFLISPAHASCEVQSCNEGREKRRKDVFDLFAFIDDMSPCIFAFPDKLGRIDMLSSCKALCRSGRIAVFIKSSLDGRAALLDFFIRLAVSSFLDEDCESSRCCVNGDFLKGNAIFSEGIFRQNAELINDSGHNISRHFFRADFQKQILTHFPRLPSAWGIPVPCASSAIPWRTFLPCF